MRITGLAVLSSVLIPPNDLAAIEALLATPAPAVGRRLLDHHGIVVEAQGYGFFLHTGLMLDDARPAAVSEGLWELLSDAERTGCDWILVDRDEPPVPGCPRFA